MNFAVIASAKVLPFSVFASFNVTFFKLFRKTLENRSLQSNFFETFWRQKVQSQKKQGMRIANCTK